MTTNDGGSAPKNEIVDVVIPTSQPTARWTPLVGKETQSLLTHLNLPDEPSRRRVREEALAVISHCVPPAQAVGSETGLVLGYIQSGKTMSFTTVAALARDNGYRMIIVIAGVSKPLLNQSEERLGKDLRLRDRLDRVWKHFSGPRLDSRPNIQGTLDEWLDPDVPSDECQTVLITVMKNVTHLRHLARLLGALSLEGVPSLVIDDEADQAGLNAGVRTGRETATYRQLVSLRKLLPQHTFLQYTATPQAPLLINLIDVLSPRFAVLLTAGDGYTGGKEFFGESTGLVKSIPQSDIPTRGNQLAAAPESLLEAMRVYFVGVAIAYVFDRLKQDQ